MKVIDVFRKFPRTFWVANSMELFERWAYYGFFMLFANYLTMSTDTGALGFTQTQKGIIMAVGTAVLYLLPILTGAIADRIGYKRTLFIAYILYLLSFIIMPYCRSFMAVFMNYLFLAVGAAMFKPIVSATVARTTDKDTSSIGFGIFYMMVNIGAFIGPLVALQFNETAFRMVFLISAGFILLNMVILLFYKEPTKNAAEGGLGDAIKTIIKNIGIALSDRKFAVFLVIVAGFWTMYYQLFFSLSVFINQWVDTSMVYDRIQHVFPWLIAAIGNSDGTIKAEYFTDIDALYIILFQLVVSSIIMKWRPLNSMITGFIVASVGMGLALMTANGMFILAALFIFSLGEMAGSPKITEYIGRIAPKDKVALYMGFSFLPIAIGNILAGIVAGPVYQQMTDKISILQREFSSRGISIPAFSEKFTKNDLVSKACSDFGLTAKELNHYLWDKYHPSHIWLVVTGIGLAASLALWLYDRFMLKSKENGG